MERGNKGRDWEERRKGNFGWDVTTKTKTELQRKIPDYGGNSCLATFQALEGCFCWKS